MLEALETLFLATLAILQCNIFKNSKFNYLGPPGQVLLPEEVVEECLAKISLLDDHVGVSKHDKGRKP